LGFWVAKTCPAKLSDQVMQRGTTFPVHTVYLADGILKCDSPCELVIDEKVIVQNNGVNRV
jgi:hypothetical protein